MNIDLKKIEQEITEYYKDILKREPDPEGLRLFVDNVINGKMTLKHVKRKINNSPEAAIIKSPKFLKFAPNFKTKLPENEIRSLVHSVPLWYHHFKFGKIETLPSRTSLNYQMWVAQGIPLDLTGKKVLDIGASDGFYSFLCESRGAKRVLAIDSLKYEGSEEKERRTKRFHICKKILNSNVEHRQMNVYDVDTLDETFDIVLLFGVYYHLENPVSALCKIFSITSEKLFLAGHILETDEPVLQYYDTRKNDTNAIAVVVASPECLLRIGSRVGFKKVQLIDSIFMNNPKKFGDIKSVGTLQFAK